MRIPGPRPLLVFAALLMGFANPAHCADTTRHISVRLLNAANGRPFKDVKVALMIWSDKDNFTWGAQANTNAEGVALLELPGQIPGRIGLWYTRDDIRSCSHMPVATAQVLNVGLVADNTCKGDKFLYRANPQPGEIVVFARPVSVWERMRQEIP